MASLIDGKFSNEPIATTTQNGEFKRASTSFRNFIKPKDAEPGRYHLYVSYACPWAHRTIITRKLKKLDKIITMSVTNPYMGDKGWSFGTPHDLEYLADVYRAADDKYTGKITVPVLWDNRKETIVNNESSEIIRIFNEAFQAHTSSTIDLYPKEVRGEIDSINERIYESLNNGVYRAGFAKTQGHHEKAVKEVFQALDEVEERLGKTQFLVGNKLTEADIRLFTTLIRFDAVYYVHFKCNLKLISQYHRIYNYMKCIYQIPEIKETCHFDHIKEHYYKSHPWINPTGLVPLGPLEDLNAPHDRGKVDFHESSFKKNVH